MTGGADVLRSRVRSAAVLGLIALVRSYKVLLSPLFAGSCRHIPSCSSYAEEAVRGHGPLLGSWLAICRLGRCRPFGSVGYDPVPVPPRTPDTRV